MSTDAPHTDHLPIIEAFLQENPEAFEELDEPPLKDRRDPLLDSERIHLEQYENDVRDVLIAILRTYHILESGFPSFYLISIDGGFGSVRL